MKDYTKYTSPLSSGRKSQSNTMRKTNYNLIAKRVYEIANSEIDVLDEGEVSKTLKRLRGYYAKLKEAPKTEETASALGECECLIYHYEVFE